MFVRNIIINYFYNILLMLRSLVIFGLGVYVGQEYSEIIPNIKSKAVDLLKNLEVFEKKNDKD